MTPNTMKNDIREPNPVTEAKHPDGGGLGAQLCSAFLKKLVWWKKPIEISKSAEEPPSHQSPPLLPTDGVRIIHAWSDDSAEWGFELQKVRMTHLGFRPFTYWLTEYKTSDVEKAKRWAEHYGIYFPSAEVSDGGGEA